MPAYPSPSTYPQLYGSEMTILDDIVVDRAMGGGAKIRALYTNPMRQWKVIHWLTNAQWATYYTDVYVALRLSTFDFTWAQNNTTYTGCAIGGAIAYEHMSYDLNQVTAFIVQK